jgi:hypothetical protein
MDALDLLLVYPLEPNTKGERINRKKRGAGKKEKGKENEGGGNGW